MAAQSDTYAYYVRRSTFDQENEHQRQAIHDWLAQEDVSVARCEDYSDTASGASRNRTGFLELIEDIENDKIDHVVVWELSRIAREGELAQEFFNLCEEHNVHVHVTSGSIREIKPDGTNRFVADILAAVYAEERRTLIRRTKYGQQRALDNGEWVGSPPLGFTTDADGYLIANAEVYEEYNPETAGFYAVQRALEKVEDGESYNSVAQNADFSRQAITKVHKDSDRKAWFLERDAEDDRVQAALDELSEFEE